MLPPTRPLPAANTRYSIWLQGHSALNGNIWQGGVIEEVEEPLMPQTSLSLPQLPNRHATAPYLLPSLLHIALLPNSFVGPKEVYHRPARCNNPYPTHIFERDAVRGMVPRSVVAAPLSQCVVRNDSQWLSRYIQTQSLTNLECCAAVARLMWVDMGFRIGGRDVGPRLPSTCLKAFDWV